MLQDAAIEPTRGVQLFVDTSVTGRAFFDIDRFISRAR